MAFPSDLTLVEIRDYWLKADGSAQKGTVTVTPSVKFKSTSTGIQVAPTPRRFTLDNQGQFAADVPATDDPDYTPTDFTYKVDVQLEGYTETYSISVPLAAAADGLDLGLLAPTASSDGLFQPLILDGGTP